MESTIALSVFAIAGLSVLAAMTYGLRLDASSRETMAASQAARRTLEQMRSYDIQDVVARYDDSDLNDPAGANTAPGSTFSVGVLEANGTPPTDAGRVVLPLDQNGFLREDLDLPELGMPRDLNGDGLIDDVDHTDDAIVLPVMVRVSWHGIGGDRQIEYRTVLR